MRARRRSLSEWVQWMRDQEAARSTSLESDTRVEQLSRRAEDAARFDLTDGATDVKSDGDRLGGK